MSVAAFAAAPTASATAKNASSVTTITWWASPISTSGPDLRKVLIADFEKAYPNIKVNLQTAPTDTDTNRADLVTTISGGANTPDVFMGDVIWPGQFGAHSLALSLTKVMLPGPGLPLLPHRPVEGGRHGRAHDVAAAADRRRHPGQSQ